jgi:hypothetical protein
MKLFETSVEWGCYLESIARLIVQKGDMRSDFHIITG